MREPVAVWVFRRICSLERQFGIRQHFQWWRRSSVELDSTGAILIDKTEMRCRRFLGLGSSGNIRVSGLRLPCRDSNISANTVQGAATIATRCHRRIAGRSIRSSQRRWLPIPERVAASA